MRYAMVALVAVVLTACGSGAQQVDVPVGPDVEAIRAARSSMAEPAQTLGTAVRVAIAAGRAARFEPAASGSDGTPDAAARSFAIDEFERRLDEVRTLTERDQSALLAELDAYVDDPDVQAARGHWERALREAKQMVVSANLEIGMLGDVLGAEATLAGLAALWDEPGSRREQTERLNEAAAQASDLVTTLTALDEAPVCAGAVERRKEAAMLVADRTAELAGYVSRGQGASFDEARASFDEQPWHEGLPGDDADDETCWTNSSAVAVSGQAVEDALLDLVDALNPTPGLTSSTPSEG